MNLTNQQRAWLEKAGVKDLVRARVKKGWTKEYYDTIYGEWYKIHHYDIDYWSQPENWKTNGKKYSAPRLQIGGYKE